MSSSQLTIPVQVLFLLIVCYINSCVGEQYHAVNSSFAKYAPKHDFKKVFLKDGPPSPWDKATIRSWSHEDEYYTCLSAKQTNITDGDTVLQTIEYCEQWTADESSSLSSQDSHREYGICTCYENSMGPYYCTYWYCIQRELYYRAGQNDRFDIQRDTEHTDCVCHYESVNGRYCQEWWCQEVNKDGTVEYEEYECQEASENGNFCEVWTGRVQSPSENEWSRCECGRSLSLGQASDLDYCSFWTCYEKELSRNYRANFSGAMYVSGIAFFLSLFCFLVIHIDQNCNSGIRFIELIAENIIYKRILALFFGIFIMGFSLMAAGVLGLFIGVGVVLINVCIWEIF